VELCQRGDRSVGQVAKDFDLTETAVREWVKQAAAAVAPLPLAARNPLLTWRIEWLALLVVPLVPAARWGGWPWGPPQLFVLLAAMCVAGVRYQRPVLWWMWALSLIPWWVWLTADLQKLNGPASAATGLSAATASMPGPSAASRRRYT
jgi:hypothetical protein